MPKKRQKSIDEIIESKMKHLKPVHNPELNVRVWSEKSLLALFQTDRQRTLSGRWIADYFQIPWMDFRLNLEDMAQRRLIDLFPKKKGDYGVRLVFWTRSPHEKQTE